MLKVDPTTKTLTPLPQSTLKQSHILERAHLQEAILQSWDAFCGELGFEELFLVGSEITPHHSCRDRIDILAIDSDGHPVIFELKRHRDKLQLLQAVSYAAMVAKWDAERFLDALPTGGNEQAEDLRAMLRSDGFSLADPCIVLLAESFDPEVILSADWLAEFGVSIQAFAISVLEHGDDTLLSIDQRFPLLGVDDVYVRRGGPHIHVSGETATWEEAVKQVNFPFAARAVAAFRKHIHGSPHRRRFNSIYSSSPLGRMSINIRRSYLKMYTVDQSAEAEETLRTRFGDVIAITPWGSDKTRNSGFTFTIETEAQLDKFLEALEDNG